MIADRHADGISNVYVRTYEKKKKHQEKTIFYFILPFDSHFFFFLHNPTPS